MAAWPWNRPPADEAEAAPLPWVLVRKGEPVLRFPSRDMAMRHWKQLRFAGMRNMAQADAALFGPNGEAWYCGRSRHAEWRRDDDRRKSDPAEAA